MIRENIFFTQGETMETFGGFKRIKISSRKSCIENIKNVPLGVGGRHFRG